MVEAAFNEFVTIPIPCLIGSYLRYREIVVDHELHPAPTDFDGSIFTDFRLLRPIEIKASHRNIRDGVVGFGYVIEDILDFERGAEYSQSVIHLVLLAQGMGRDVVAHGGITR